MNRLAAVLLALSAAAAGQDPRQIIEEVQKRSRADSQRYEGELEVVDAKSRVTTKRWQYDRLGSFGDSKAVLRFTAPPEVKGVALLVHNHQDRSSDQWMWTPALQRDRRIALQDRSTRFFGTGFTFEDLEERDVTHNDYKLLGEESIGGKPCWKLESRPRKTKTSQYTHVYLWVRKDIYAFVRIEGYKNDELVRSISYQDIQEVKGIWTARKMTVDEPARKTKTTLSLDKLDYNLKLDDSEFTLQGLRRGQ